MTEITINGERHQLADPDLIAALVAEGADPAQKGIAVARNGAVVPRSQWSATRLEPGDRLEIVKVFAGG